MFKLAVCKFYSRIVLNKLDEQSFASYRKVEKSLKILTKTNADIQFLKYYENKI